MSEWINIEDRLPEESGKYLVVTYQYPYARKEYGDAKIINVTHFNTHPIGRFFDPPPTHWMPLPDVPK